MSLCLISFCSAAVIKLLLISSYSLRQTSRSTIAV
jgi:hypothetical protein